MIELDSDSIKYVDADSLYEALFFTLEAILPNQDENRLSPRHAVMPKGKGEYTAFIFEYRLSRIADS